MNTDRSLELVERYNEILKRTEDRYIRRINQALMASFVRLEEELRRKYPSLKENRSLLPSQRAILLAAEIKNLLVITGNHDYNQEFYELINLSSQHGVTLGSLLIDAMEEPNFIKRTTNIPLEAVKYAAEEQTQRLERWGLTFSTNATSIVEQGLILGWGTDKIATYLQNEVGTTQKHAQQIARTASLSASNQAVQAQFLANNITYFQYTATNDDRVCPYCIARNMKVYKLGESRPPIHVNCRCFSMPWKEKWQELGLTKDEWAREFRQKTLEESGVKLNNGVSPFERAAGLTEPPKPFWEP